MILDVVWTNQWKKLFQKKKKEIQIKGKNDFKPSVVVEAILEELVETNQLLTNVNNLREPFTISTDKIELIELARDSVLLTGFRFIGLFILSDVFSLLACLNWSTANTLKLLAIEDKKKDLRKIYGN